MVHLVTLGGCLARVNYKDVNTGKMETVVDNRVVYNLLANYADTNGNITFVWSNLFNKSTSWLIEDAEILRIKKTLLESPINLVLITMGTNHMSTIGSQLYDLAIKNKKKIVITGGWGNSIHEYGPDRDRESRGFNLGNALAYLLTLQEDGVWICYGGILRKVYVCDDNGKYLLKIHNSYEQIYQASQQMKY